MKEGKKMSDQEKKEQEIMSQEMSFDEMETVAGGAGSNDEITVSDGTVVAAWATACIV